MDYRYQLAPYAGPSSRLVCPNCGKRDFVPYIDTQTGEILDETCGRCNRESHCGYHLPPSEFFKQNPGARPQGDAWREEPDWLRQKLQSARASHAKPKASLPVNTLPAEIVQKTIRMEPRSNLVKYLENTFDPLITEGLVVMYNLGVTRDLATIYYQRDRKGRYRGGKIIQYDPATGHRIKDGPCPVSWVHQFFQRHGYIPQDWKMTQCLFGEHLLDQYPDAIVCLVEAEKSAVICAGLMPEYVWVATGGKTQLGERLDVLQGRTVIAFPDVDAYDEWTEYFQGRLDLNVTVSDLLEENATDEDRENQIDIADLLIRWHLQGGQSSQNVSTVPPSTKTERQLPQFTNPVTAEVAKYFSPEFLPELDALITDLDLVPVSVQYIEPTETNQ
jgi:hypothetical protein